MESEQTAQPRKAKQHTRMHASFAEEGTGDLAEPMVEGPDYAARVAALSARKGPSLHSNSSYSQMSPAKRSAIKCGVWGTFIGIAFLAVYYSMATHKQKTLAPTQPPAPAPDACLLGTALNRFTGHCDRVPRWKLTGGLGETVCFDETWNMDGSPTTAFSKSGYPTCMTLSAEEAGIRVVMVAYNDRIQANAFTVDNTDMWNQEVMELFVTVDTTSAKPEHYHEVEVTPAGAVWLSSNTNPGGERANLTHTLIDPGALGPPPQVQTQPPNPPARLAVLFAYR